METDGDEMNPMDLLAPDVCINESDTLMTYNDTNSAKAQPEVNHNNDVQEIIDVDDESDGVPNTVNGFNHDANIDKGEDLFKPGQIPDPFSEEELAAFPNLFGEGQQSIQYQRLHCTACNAHLGSAPYNQQDRYIHPLLKVLICKSCFDFYGSGDFDKDEDGSELYCRWCGQGGKVLCCAQCPCVFCQKCIRVNQGKKALDKVLQSDDWLCFVCNTQQIMKQRMMCRALYDYVQNELATWRPLNRPDILDLDKSLCCKARAANVPKRKSQDENFKVETEKKPKKKKYCVNPLSKANAPKKLILKKVITSNEKNKPIPNAGVWESRPEDEVVCTPDLLMIMNFDEGIEPTVLEEDMNEDGSEVISVTESTPVDGELTPAKKKYKKNKSETGPVKKYPALKKLLNKNFQKVKNNKLKSLPNIQIKSYQCIDKTIVATIEANQNLNTKICSLSSEQKQICSIDGLIKLHNDFQVVLGEVIQSLTEIRKNLRADFISDLKNINNENSNELESNNDDNDVIIIDSSTETIPNGNELPPTISETIRPFKSHGYIKVKPPSELLASSVISKQNASLDPAASESQPVNTEKTVQKPAKAQIDCKTKETPVNTNSIAKKGTPFEEMVKSIKTSIPNDVLEQMATVKVVIGKEMGSNALQLHSCKTYKPFKITVQEETVNCDENEASSATCPESSENSQKEGNQSEKDHRDETLSDNVIMV